MHLTHARGWEGTCPPLMEIGKTAISLENLSQELFVTHIDLRYDFILTEVLKQSQAENLM